MKRNCQLVAVINRSGDWQATSKSTGEDFDAGLADRNYLVVVKGKWLFKSNGTQ